VPAAGGAPPPPPPEHLQLVHQKVHAAVGQPLNQHRSMKSGQVLRSRKALAEPIVLFIEHDRCTPPASQWRVRNRIITELLN